MEVEVRLAIVADDLTGALDVSAPFAVRGLRVVVATTPSGTAAAIASGAGVVCVNTASREIPAEAAVAVVAATSRQLAHAAPEIAFKKVDSRLKGHVALEVEAMMAAFGRRHAAVVPAIPTQGRLVANGHVVGSGLSTPLSIASVMGDAISYEAPDTADADDLTAVARSGTKDVLLVGASGLGASLAGLLASGSGGFAPPIAGPLLVAVGSRDPVTLAQVEHALAGSAFAHIISRDGSFGTILGGPALVQAMIPRTAPDFSAAMTRFGASVADLLRSGSFSTVLLTGGETAQSVLGELGIECLEVLGEVLPGIPITRAVLGDRTLTILTKSGGFGTPQDILRLARIADGTKPVTEHAFAGEHR
jgi:uncharacterized protein YgbK (DUF1537 family)